MFKTITSVLDKTKTPNEDEINKIPSFIFCKWLTNNPYTIHDANIINQYSDIPMTTQYRFIKAKHAGKIKYIQWIKKSDEVSKDIEILARHFKVSLEKAKEYKQIISKDELQSILDLYIDGR